MKMKTHAKLLIPVIAVMTFFFGFENGAFQLALLKVAREFTLSPTAMGALVAVQFLGIVILPLICGPISDRIGKKKVLVCFTFLFAAGCILASAAGSAWSFMAGVFMIGASVGVIESQEAAIVADVLGESAGRKMSFIHCAFSAGAVLSPLMLEYCMENLGASWRLGFWVPGIGFGALLLPLLLTDCGSASLARTKEEGKSGSLRSLFTPVYVALVASILLYMALETGPSYYYDTMFTTLFPGSGYNALSISLFWLAVTGARFVFGMVKLPPRKIIAWCFTAAVPVLFALGLSQNAVLSLVLCVLAGFSFAPVWPLLVTEAARVHPARSGTATSIMSASSGVGAVAAPVLMGWVSEAFSLRGSFITMAAFAAIGSAICMWTFIRVKKD